MSTDAAQMIERVRYPINNIAYISIMMTNRNITGLTDTIIVNGLRDTTEHIFAENDTLEEIANYHIDPLGFNVYDRDSDWCNLYIDNELTRNLDLYNFK